MQYLLLIYHDEKTHADMPEAQRRAFSQEYMEVTQAMVKGGQFRAGAQLQPSSSATTVREKAGKRVTSDGPFVETKEQLGGYYLVECKDLDEALAIAARIPSLRIGGSIEVRPIVPMQGPDTPAATAR